MKMTKCIKDHYSQYR